MQTSREKREKTQSFTPTYGPQGGGRQSLRSQRKEGTAVPWWVRSITKNVIRDMWVQVRWTGAGPLPWRVTDHIYQTGGERWQEMKNVIKPQKTDKYTQRSVQWTLKSCFGRVWRRMKGQPATWGNSHRVLINGAGTPRPEQANRPNEQWAKSKTPTFIAGNPKIFCKKYLDVITFLLPVGHLYY